jgi:succinyl-diaminopimelate desuccinylase
VDIVDRLTEIVAIPSVSGDEAAIADHIEGLIRVRRPSWPLTRIGHNLVLGPVTGAGTGRPHVALVGHVDTVPPQGNQSPHVEDGNLYGIGACDMKGGVAVMLDLVDTVPDDLPVDLTWIFYDNEEVTYDANGLGKVLPATPWLADVDFAFVLEPTGGELEVGCNGYAVAEVVFHGKSAHSARPWLGENAIHKAGAFLQTLAGIDPIEVAVGEATYKQVVQATWAEGGIARNVVPDRFMVVVNHRFPPGRTIADAEAYLRSLAPPGADVTIPDIAAPGAVPEANRVYDAFRARYRPIIRGKQGWTDVSRLTAAGIAAVNYGPGHPELAHRSDEHVPVAQLRAVRDRLHEFLSTYSDD